MYETPCEEDQKRISIATAVEMLAVTILLFSKDTMAVYSHRVRKNEKSVCLTRETSGLSSLVPRVVVFCALFTTLYDQAIQLKMGTER